MIDEKIYEQLKNNQIQVLDLSRHNIKDIDKLSEILKYNTSLTKLDLKRNEIENIDILSESLKYNNSLIYLHLTNNNINKNDLNNLQKNNKRIEIYF